MLNGASQVKINRRFKRPLTKTVFLYFIFLLNHRFA